MHAESQLEVAENKGGERREGNLNFVKFGKTENTVDSERSVHRACAPLRPMCDGAVNAPEQTYAEGPLRARLHGALPTVAC